MPFLIFLNRHPSRGLLSTWLVIQSLAVVPAAHWVRLPCFSSVAPG